MTSKVLGIDLRDAGRDGVYPVVPDDPPTLVDDARRAGLCLLRVDLRDCRDGGCALEQLAEAFELPESEADWHGLGQRLCELDWLLAPGYVLLLDHANNLHRTAAADYGAMRAMLTRVAQHWHIRGVPFFVFMEFPDNETRDAAIDA